MLKCEKCGLEYTTALPEPGICYHCGGKVSEKAVPPSTGKRGVWRCGTCNAAYPENEGKQGPFTCLVIGCGGRQFWDDQVVFEHGHIAPLPIHVQEIPASAMQADFVTIPITPPAPPPVAPWEQEPQPQRAGVTTPDAAAPITAHQGKKYLRLIWPADGKGEPILVDIYEVIVAYAVTCPGRQQALKKLLMAGDRAKGDAVADLHGVLAATNRAIELEQQRQCRMDYGTTGE